MLTLKTLYIGALPQEQKEADEGKARQGQSSSKMTFVQ